MKNCKSIDELLSKTNNGERTVMLFHEGQYDNIRIHHPDIGSNLMAFSLKPKKGVHSVFVQAKDDDTLSLLKELLEGKYRILGPKGQVSLPIPAAA